MSSDRIMRMIRRMEILVDSAESIAREYPNVLKEPGFFGGLFVNSEEDDARNRFQSICSEVMGVGASIKDIFRENGLSLKSESMSKLADNTDACSGREIINLMRAFIGFVRSKAYEL